MSVSLYVCTRRGDVTGPRTRVSRGSFPVHVSLGAGLCFAVPEKPVSARASEREGGGGGRERESEAELSACLILHSHFRSLSLSPSLSLSHTHTHTHMVLPSDSLSLSLSLSHTHTQHTAQAWDTFEAMALQRLAKQLS